MRAFPNFGLPGQMSAQFLDEPSEQVRAAATQTVEHRSLDAEVHTLHSGRSLHLESIVGSSEALDLVLVEDERTDGSVRTDVSTLVTLDTVVLVPNGNEGLYTALLVSSSTRSTFGRLASPRTSQEPSTVPCFTKSLTFSRSPAWALIGRTSSFTNAGASSCFSSSAGRFFD